MYGQGYVGTSQDANKIRKQEKLREEQRKKNEEQQQELKAKVESAGLKQFGKSTSETLEAVFKNETVGLITREEFIQKRNTLQERLAEEVKRKQREVEEVALKEKEARRKEKSRLAEKAKLSFLGDEEGDEEQEGDKAGPSEEPNSKRQKFGKLGKDPTVATDFLPDRDRDRAEEELRAQLKKEWVEEQERLRAEPLTITYSYWDGQGHRRKITVKQGDSIGGFLKAVRDQLSAEFRELRAVSVDNLMYIKEDLILPHHHTFYDLITSKARGKSGPLFDFDVHDDIRITNDATVEKTDSHAGKVVERHWYDKNKHIFPASRWEVYDLDKTYDKYTIFG